MGFGDFVKSAGGGSIIGSAIGAAGSLIGGGMSNNAAAAQAALQYAHQKEFAQNGVRWKVEDAKRAGIHPLAALGAQTFSYNPVMTTPGYNGIGEALGRMGQGIERAVEAKQLQEERDEAKARQEMQDVFTFARNQKEIEHLDLQNEFLMTQIDGARQQIAKSALPPPMPRVNEKTGLISRKDAAYHVWNMGGGNYSVLWNPDYTQSIGDEAGQVFNLAEAAKNAYKHGIWSDPETGVVYAYNKDTGWWNRRGPLSPEETARLYGKHSPPAPRAPDSHFMRNRYRYRY